MSKYKKNGYDCLDKCGNKTSWGGLCRKCAGKNRIGKSFHKVKTCKCNFCKAKRGEGKGKDHPQYKGKIKVFCRVCNKSKEIYPSRHKRTKIHYCSEKCKSKWQSKNIRGKKHPNYIEGLSRKYPRKFTEKLKHQIRLRDNYQCQNRKCNITEEEHVKKYKRVLHVHHIDHHKDNLKKKNLITTCCVCNNLANKEYEYWEKYYKQIIKEKYVS